MPNSPEISEQYHAVQRVGGWCARDDRGVIEVTGKDRATWLNNLVSNVVKNLSPGEGNYAFATDIKGRVVFDLGILVLDDRLWLDVDPRWIDKALRHLNKYVITEDVAIADRTEEIRRIAVIGPAAQLVADSLGVGNFSAMAQWQHVPASASEGLRLVRYDFAGLPAMDIYVDNSECESVKQMIGSSAREIDHAVVGILRIEAGIPASIDDIDENVVPPETGRIEQGISYHKGCYLGQEVIERMRSHGVLARKLVGLKLDGDEIPLRNSMITSGEKEVGRITSACWSEALGSILALGYVKTTSSTVNSNLSANDRNAEVIALPVRAAEGEARA